MSDTSACPALGENGVCRKPICSCGGFTLKERYEAHRDACRDTCDQIEGHDPKMAKAARKLLKI